MAIVNCEVCGKQESYDMKPGYPKKYCTECGAARKAAYANKVATPAPFVAPTAKEAIKQAGGAQLLSVKDIQIISQCMMKCMFYAKAPKDPKEVYDAWHYFVKELEENG